MITGFIILIFACLCQGSFGLGYKNYKPFSWESFWGVYSLYCALVPLLWTVMLIPGFLPYLTAEPKATVTAILCGVVWGISAICFSKGVTMIGMSLVYGISMGISAIVGSVIPLFTADSLPKLSSMLLLMSGLCGTLLGIFVITKAGLIKDKENNQQCNGSMKLGLIFSMISGLGAGVMNVGFDSLSKVGNAVVANGYSDTTASAIQWLPVLFGGACAGMSYCAYSMTKNKTWKTYAMQGSVKRFAVLFLTAIVWFAALAAYGIASLKLGELGPVVGWILFNAIALIVSNGWGLKVGEWRGSDKAKKVLFIGNGILIISWLITALSNI